GRAHRRARRPALCAGEPGPVDGHQRRGGAAARQRQVPETLQRDGRGNREEGRQVARNERGGHGSSLAGGKETVSTPRHRYIAVRPFPAAATGRFGSRRWTHQAPVRRYGIALVVLRRLLALALAVFALGLVSVLAFKFWVDGQT